MSKDVLDILMDLARYTVKSKITIDPASEMCNSGKQNQLMDG